MATAVTTDTLRGLAGFRAGNGCALSIHIDLDPSSTPTIPDVETKVNSILAEAEKAAESGSSHGRDCRLALRDDLQRIRDWWDDEFDRDGARGVALFASSADGFFRALPLAEGVGDAVHLGPALHISPLVGALDRDGALVAFISRERGTVYRFQGGRLEEVADETEEQPGQHDQGGWSQARYQRHIDKLVQQHLKTVGDQIDKRVRLSGDLMIVGIAPEEMRGDFESELSAEAREALVGWATAEAHSGANELLGLVQPLIDGAHARREQELLDRLQEARGRGGRAAAGWDETLEAASDARIDTLLVEE